jgi:hypothetical protein
MVPEPAWFQIVILLGVSLGSRTPEGQPDEAVLAIMAMIVGKNETHIPGLGLRDSNRLDF